MQCPQLPYADTMEGFQSHPARSPSAGRLPSNKSPRRRPDATRKNWARSSLFGYLRRKNRLFQVNESAGVWTPPAPPVIPPSLPQTFRCLLSHQTPLQERGQHQNQTPQVCSKAEYLRAFWPTLVMTAAWAQVGKNP